MLEPIQSALQKLESVIPGNDQSIALALAELKGSITKLGRQTNRGMIHADVRELARSFHGHLKASCKLEPGDCNTSASLLLFYATECGLKSIWLKERRYSSTQDIPTKTLSDHGHDLGFWMKELRVPRSVLSQNLSFRLNSNRANHGQISLDISKAHEAWRYGIVMTDEDHRRLKKCLSEFCSQWIKERI